MRRVLQTTLGIVTAIGAFVDIGNLVTSGIAGARFGMSLTWAIVLGTIGRSVVPRGSAITTVSPCPYWPGQTTRAFTGFATIRGSVKPAGATQ